MTWKTVRLELAPSASFPRGSPSRAYLLRVPLDENGEIDGAMLARSPSRATARRFWSSEPDQFGHIERSDGHWLLRCQGDRGEALFRMPALPLRLHGHITVEEPDGTSSSFRVASISGNGPRVRAIS